EWLSKWLESRNIQYRTQPNTQELPDFLLDRDSHTKGLLEIKTFDSDRSLKNNSYRLDADSLIFSYKLVDYKFTIAKVWLKKIWEITPFSKIIAKNSV
ncbi:MAG: NgoBV family restriction endonuclease, partial [Prochloraceae cyanobacterium]